MKLFSAPTVTVTAIADVPDVAVVPDVPFYGENRLYGSEKQAFKKAERPVNGPGRPSTGLYPLLGIYTHGRQKASKLAIFRDVLYWYDRNGQF